MPSSTFSRDATPDTSRDETGRFLFLKHNTNKSCTFFLGAEDRLFKLSILPTTIYFCDTAREAEAWAKTQVDKSASFLNNVKDRLHQDIRSIVCFLFCNSLGVKPLRVREFVIGCICSICN